MYTTDKMDYILYVNTTFCFGSLLGTNLMNNAIYKTLNPGAKSEQVITSAIAPLPYNTFQNNIFGGMSSYSSPIIVVLSMAFIPAYYASYIVKEKEVKIQFI